MATKLLLAFGSALNLCLISGLKTAKRGLMIDWCGLKDAHHIISVMQDHAPQKSGSPKMVNPEWMLLLPWSPWAPDWGPDPVAQLRVTSSTAGS